MGEGFKAKKEIQPPTSEKKTEAVFYFFIFLNWDFDLEISHLRTKEFILTVIYEPESNRFVKVA